MATASSSKIVPATAPNNGSAAPIGVLLFDRTTLHEMTLRVEAQSGPVTLARPRQLSARNRGKGMRFQLLIIAATEASEGP
jgi:hypothetical protein